MRDRTLTQGQKAMIEQVAATMAIEDMYLSERCLETLRRIAAGEISEEEAAAELVRRYAHA